MSTSKPSIGLFVRHLAIRMVAITAAFAVAFPVVSVSGIGVGQAEAGSKQGGAVKTHRGGVKRLRLKRSGGHRVVRSQGVRKMTVAGHKRVEGSVRSGSRSYTVRRSVLDGRGHGSVRKGTMHNVKRYGGENRHEAGNNRRFVGHDKSSGRVAEKRSGVRLSRTTNVTTTSVKGLTEIAGSRNVVRKTRLGSKGHHKGHGKGYRHRAAGFSAAGALVVVIEGGHSRGFQEVAGGDGDCAYGSYCTIDLGGPKIITYNDVADISDGSIADENLTDEEYYEKYGGK